MAFTEDTPTSINADTNFNLRQRKLDTDKTLTVYGTNSPSRTNARVIDVSGGSISAGAENAIWDTNRVFEPDIWVIDTTTAVIAGAEVGSGNDAEIRTLSISGTTVTENAAASIETPVGSYTDFRICMVSATVGLVSYYDTDSTKSRLCRFTVSGTTVTPGTPEDHVTSTDTQIFGMCALDSTRVFIAYEGVVANETYFQVIDISSSISKGTATVNLAEEVDTDLTGWYPCVLLDTDKVVIVYKLSSAQTDTRVKAFVVTTSGDSIAAIGSGFGLTDIETGVTTALAHSVDLINTSKVIVTYSQNEAAPRDLFVKILFVSGTSITGTGESIVTTKNVAVSGAGSNSVLHTVDTDQYIHSVIDTASSDAFTTLITGTTAYDWQHSGGGLPGAII